MNEYKNKIVLKRKDILYPELSYKIIGCAFDVYNELGAGHHEKFYQKALSLAFKKSGLKFVEQIYYPLKYKNTIIGKGYFDFLVEEKIIVEIKRGNKFSGSNINQVLEYLKMSNKKLAMLINFTRGGVIYRRIININKNNS